ncbi:hypothetical protein R3P38DRAFT_537997 [Favolaschia claudopus]|uniref:Uncharacterized protein n=1 Tax=Favolaschia claudopus TaxID=2862362 RepID=A0AAW0CGI9_9AGAR
MCGWFEVSTFYESGDRSGGSQTCYTRSQRQEGVYNLGTNACVYDKPFQVADFPPTMEALPEHLTRKPSLELTRFSSMFEKWDLASDESLPVSDTGSQLCDPESSTSSQTIASGTDSDTSGVSHMRQRTTTACEQCRMRKTKARHFLPPACLSNQNFSARAITLSAHAAQPEVSSVNTLSGSSAFAAQQRPDYGTPCLLLRLNFVSRGICCTVQSV